MLKTVRRRLDYLARFCAAVVLLLVYGPLIGFIALAVSLDSAGPIFSKRNSRCAGRPDVANYVFRTVIEDEGDGDAEKPIESCPTRIGIFLRNSGLNRLPLLLSVLHGRMPLGISGDMPH
jgi:polysaccharide biosynthesis protein PslA